MAQGERLHAALLARRGARIIAEDLGIVPDFVRESLARLRMPGLKVLRWERDWHAPGQPFRDPADYPAESVAISGTHDTETLAEWWDGAEPEERQLCAAFPALREAGCDPDAPFSPPCATRSSGAVRRRLRLRHRPVPGYLRLARPHQHAGGGQRRELDLAAALALCDRLLRATAARGAASAAAVSCADLAARATRSRDYSRKADLNSSSPPPWPPLLAWQALVGPLMSWDH